MEITGHYMALNERYLKYLDYGNKFLLGVRVDKDIEELINNKLIDRDFEPDERVQSSNENGFVSRFNANYYGNLYKFTTVGTLNVMLLSDTEGDTYIVVDRIFVSHEVYVNKFFYESCYYNNAKLAANLLLELFKRVTVLNHELFSDIDTILVTVPWGILPFGITMTEDIREMSNREPSKPKKENTTEYIDYLKSKKLTLIAKGKENYSNYLVFKFKDDDFSLFEPMEYGNATYIINGDWKEVSKYSRSELKQSGRGFPIIHDGFDQWKDNIAKYI